MTPASTIRQYLKARNMQPKQLAREAWIGYRALMYMIKGQYKGPALRRVLEHIKFMEDNYDS